MVSARARSRRTRTGVGASPKIGNANSNAPMRRNASARPCESKFRTPAGRQADMIAPLNDGHGAVLSVDRNAIDGDDAKLLRTAPEKHR